jgi:methyl-accepting chemotaxis protein
MLKNLTIRTRLLLAFGLISLLLLVASIDGWLGTKDIVETAKIMQRELQLTQVATQLRADALQLRRFEKDTLINLDKADKAQDYRDKWEQALQSAKQTRVAGTELAAGETLVSLQALESEITAYAVGFRTVADDIRTGKLTTITQANDAMNQHKPAAHRVEDLIGKILGAASEESSHVDELMQSHRDSVTTTLVVLTAVSLLFAVVLSLTITRSIVEPVRSAVQLARSVADGKLGHDFKVTHRDEIAELLHELNRMDNKLCEIMSEVHSGSVKVRSAAAELAENNDQLAQRTQEQAGSLEQTAASIEEMTVSVKTNADSATSASTLARGTSQIAAAGGEVVSSAVSAMTAINESSRRISDIISVIDEIAFQTNLLALNAAVEAARAGEQGRGFAVVAGEVRSLAQRSAQAAKEIKQLIGDSVDKVRVGSDLVSKSGQQLRQIVESVQRVTNVVEEIASANSQQAAGISQLNDAVAQLDQITQQNAAGTEEIAAASRMMYEQSERLATSIAYFSIQGRAGVIATPPVARPRAVAAVEVSDEPRYEARYGT